MNLGDIFNLLLLQPIINLTVLILRVLEALHIPGEAGLSIIVITILINLIIWPFRSKQMKITKLSQQKNQELKPQFEALQKKHGDNKMAFQQAKAALLKEHGVSPTAGCLPAIIPILLIFPLYQVIYALFGLNGGLSKLNYFLYSPSWHLNKLPNPDFLGLNLGWKPADFSHISPLLLLVPVVTAGLQFLLSKMMLPSVVKSYPGDSKKEKQDKESMEDSLMAAQGQMMYMMPIMIAVFSFQLPIGLSLYWNTLSLMNILQQYQISKAGSSALIEVAKDPTKKVKKSGSTKVTIERSK